MAYGNNRATAVEDNGSNKYRQLAENAQQQMNEYWSQYSTPVNNPVNNNDEDDAVAERKRKLAEEKARREEVQRQNQAAAEAQRKAYEESLARAEAIRQQQAEEAERERQRQAYEEAQRKSAEERARREELQRQQQAAAEAQQRAYQESLARAEAIRQQQEQQRQQEEASRQAEIAAAQQRQADAREAVESANEINNPVNTQPETIPQADTIEEQPGTQVNNPVNYFRDATPGNQRYDARYPRTTPAATSTTTTTTRAGKYAGEYPEYTGQQPELYGQRNKNADYYRGRELMQPVYTTTEQSKNAFKAGSKMTADETEDQTEFYTGPTTTEETPAPVTNPLAFKMDIPGLSVGPNVTVPNPTEVGIQNAIQAYNNSDNPLTEWLGKSYPKYTGNNDARQPYSGFYRGRELMQPSDNSSGTNPFLEGLGNAAHEVVSDYDTAITNSDDVILDALAGLYNASESDGWLTQQVSDLYGNLPAIDPESPGADILEQQRRDRLADLVRQIQADDELVDDRPDITGKELKTALKDSQQETREFTDRLVRAAREVTQPMKKDLVDWATSGSGYGDAVTLASDAAIEAGLTPGTAAYDRFVDNYVSKYTPPSTSTADNVVNPPSYTEAWEQADKAARDAGIPEGTNDYDRFVENYVSNINPLFNEPRYGEIEQEVRKEFSDLNSTYANELANGDPRNIPPEAFAETFRYLTGDTQYAEELEKEYQRFKDLGMNDRQISAELYRRAAEHMNPLARATDAQGNQHYDFALAGSGILPEDMAIPTVDEYGNGNAAYNEFSNSVDYFDDKGNTIFRNPDGTFTEAILSDDGKTVTGYKPYTGNVTSTYHYTPDQVLSMYVNPNGGRNGESAWRGLDSVFEGLTPEERAGMEELLANFVGGGDLNRLRDGFSRELTGMTEAEYERLAQLFLNKMPALQGLINQGVLSEKDLANFFFKAPNGSGSGSGSGGGSKSGGSGSYSGRSYSGYSGSGYSGKSSGGYNRYSGYSSGYNNGGYSSSYTPRSNSSGGYYGNYGNGSVGRSNVTPSTTSQRQNRVYNIMKNWSF